MKQFKILSVATVFLIIGVLVAYRNTAYLGYNKSYIVSINSDSVDVMDYHIEYNTGKEKSENIKKIVPDTFMTI